MSYSDGIDRYEAQRIAEDAARHAADNAERNVGYELERLRDEIRSLERRLDEEQQSRRADTTDLRDGLSEVCGAINDLWGLVKGGVQA